MDPEVKIGMTSLKKKIRAKELTIIPTDESNKISVMLPGTYEVSMEEHYKNDKLIDKKELNKIQRTLNGHSKNAVKIFKVGDEHKQHKRAPFM